MALVEHMAVCGNKCHLSYLLEPSDVSRAGPPNNRIRLVLRHMGTATNLNPTKYGQTSWPQNAHSRPPKVFPWHSRGDTPEGKKERGDSLEEGGGDVYLQKVFWPWPLAAEEEEETPGIPARTQDGGGMAPGGERERLVG